MALTLQQYIDYLDSRGAPWPAPPAVERPKAAPHLFRLPNIRAVTWNVYGTLLAITGGTLYFEHPDKMMMDLALGKTIEEFRMWNSMSRKPGQPSEYLGPLYAMQLHQMRTVPAGGERYPEVAVDRVWEALLKKLLKNDYKFDAGSYGSLNEFSRKVAYFFHASLQGTECYAGASTALRCVAGRRLAQGLVGDGQCFTVGQLQRCLKLQDPKANLDELIDSKLCFLSYSVKARLPSERPLRAALAVLSEQGIAPEQVLHVGSRVTTDVVPARRLRMRTALFAGDKASLEATGEQFERPQCRPDILMTELEQIAEVIG